MNENRDISAFYDILNYIRVQYGDDIALSPKRLKALLSDLNPQFKDEEKKVIFLINENQSFVRNVYQQQNISADTIFREIEKLCGFNKRWTQILTESLLIITGKIDECHSMTSDSDEESLNTNLERDKVEGEQISKDDTVERTRLNCKDYGNKVNTTERIKRFLSTHYMLSNCIIGAIIGLIIAGVYFMPKQTEKDNNGLPMTTQQMIMDHQEMDTETADTADTETSFLLGNDGTTVDKGIQVEYTSFMANARNKRTDEWSGCIWANLTDEIEIVIKYEILPEESARNVIIQDTLPTCMSYVSGSTYLYDDDSQEGVNMDDSICDSGVRIGEYGSTSHGIVKFSAVFAGKSDLTKGNNELINNASMVVNEDVYENAKSSIMVTIY